MKNVQAGDGNKYMLTVGEGSGQLDPYTISAVLAQHLLEPAPSAAARPDTHLHVPQAGHRVGPASGQVALLAVEREGEDGGGVALHRPHPAHFGKCKNLHLPCWAGRSRHKRSRAEWQAGRERVVVAQRRF